MSKMMMSIRKEHIIGMKEREPFLPSPERQHGGEKKKVFVLFVDGETKELCRSGHAAQILISSQVRMMMMKDRGVTWAPHFVDRDVTLAASSCLSRLHFFVSDSKEREKNKTKKPTRFLISFFGVIISSALMKAPH